MNFKDEAEIIATIVCGDSYFNENLEKAKADILAMVKEQAPDVFIAGPAFNAGRYGVPAAPSRQLSRKSWASLQ